MPSVLRPDEDVFSAVLDGAPLHPGSGFVARLDDQPIEGGIDPTFGEVVWRTLISSDRTTSNGIVLGVAEFPAHGKLNPHRHAPPEFYFCTSGSGIVTLNGVQHTIQAGHAVYVPGDSEHGVVAGPAGLTFVYGFGEDSFSEIEYRFTAANG